MALPGSPCSGSCAFAVLRRAKNDPLACSVAEAASCAGTVGSCKQRSRLSPIRQGVVSPEGSWLYVWLDTSDGSIAYFGATGFDPELRAFLHLTSDSSELGRVRATVPRFDERDFDVLAFELDLDCSRPAVKQALASRLSDLGLIEPPSGDRPVPMPPVIEPIIDTLRAYIAQRR